MAKNIAYVPKTDEPAEWIFYPNDKTRKKYPNAELEALTMDCQEGEMISVSPKSKNMLDKSLIVEIAEGRIELLHFDENWKESDHDEDSVTWDIHRVIHAWSDDE
jgi:hypothetical protein